MRKRSKITNPGASKLKNVFTLEDMHNAFDSGAARIIWMDGGRGKEPPSFEDFIKQEYSV